MPRPNKGPHLNWRKDRRTWEVVWYERGKRRSRSAGTESLGRAKDVLQGVILEKEPIGPRDPAQRRIADVLTAYATEHAPNTADPQRIAECIQALLPWWGSLFIDDITEPTCRGYVRSRNVSDGTAIRELTTLRAAVNRDYRMGRLTQTRAVWTPPKPPPASEWLTRKEVAKLLRTAREHRRTRRYLPFYILMLFYTGARPSYPLTLRRPQVDLERRLIDYRLPGETQTSKCRAVVPIARPLMTFMRIYCRRAGATGHIIRRANGRPIVSLKKAFGAVVKDAKLKKRITPKTMRHTFASLAIQAGVPPWKVAKAMGHSTSRMVESTYGHLAPDHLRDVVDWRVRG